MLAVPEGSHPDRQALKAKNRPGKDDMAAWGTALSSVGPSGTQVLSGGMVLCPVQEQSSDEEDVCVCGKQGSKHSAYTRTC